MESSRAHAITFDALFGPQEAAVNQTPSHGDRLPNNRMGSRKSSTSADVSRATPLSINDIFGPAANHYEAPASDSAGEPSQTASTSHAAIHLDWAESSSEDEVRTDQQAIGGQLWGSELFLAGYSAPAVWEVCNLEATQQWRCPCSKGAGGTNSCLDASRIDVVKLYEFRKAFHSRAGRNLRDTMRDDLERHYDARDKSFSKGFRVGPCADCCAPAYGLACGLSFTTFARARADVTLGRPRRAERRQRKTIEHDEGAAQVRGYLNSLKSKLEGSKGGTYVGGTTKFYTAAKTDKRLYEDYKAQMNLDSVPVRCTTVKAFMEIWKADKSIIEVSPTGHSICDVCAGFQAREAALGSRIDAEAVRLRKELDEDDREHKRVEGASRAYFDNATYEAEHRPDLVTMINIDAPTRRQFDLPRHPRYRDIPKGLESLKRWESKVTGVMDAGLGMRVFVVHESVGGGPNLVATVLYLSLLAHVASGRPLGRKLFLQLDNTCGENKCQAVLATVGWLVQVFSFDEALINCCPVGHTFTILDESFNTLINGMNQTTLATVEEMLDCIQERMRAYQCQEATELKAVFDFSTWFKPIMHLIEGIARRGALGGLYSGMGQFLFLRDAVGKVRLKMRTGPTATTWIPESEGYLLFHEGQLDSPIGFEAGPPLAPLKSFAAWQKETSVANVRRWLPYLGVDQPAQRDAAAKWEARFASLTQTVTDLQTPSPTIWQGPPERRNDGATARETGGDGARRPWIGIADNPPINPIDHAGTSTSKSYKERLAAWRAATRVHAAQAGSSPPVHLSDYLIVRDATCPALIRITGGTLGVGGGTVKVSGTAYVDAPNQSVPNHWGWGTFAPKRNDAYDPNDRSKGTYHVLRHDITRSDILVYAAMTFLDGREELRLHIDSLKALAQFINYPLPEPLPSTHLRCPSGEAATYVPPAKRATAPDAAPARGPVGTAPVGAAPAGAAPSTAPTGAGSGKKRVTHPTAAAAGAAAPTPGAEDADNLGTEDDVYEVEVLLDRKLSRGKRQDGTRKGTWMYLVKWKGWEGHEHAQTWEDAKNVDNSLIAAYEDDHGSAHESDELEEPCRPPGPAAPKDDSKRPAAPAKGKRQPARLKIKKRTLMESDHDSSEDD